MCRGRCCRLTLIAEARTECTRPKSSPAGAPGAAAVAALSAGSMPSSELWPLGASPPSSAESVACSSTSGMSVSAGSGVSSSSSWMRSCCQPSESMMPAAAGSEGIYGHASMFVLKSTAAAANQQRGVLLLVMPGTAGVGRQVAAANNVVC